MPPKASTSVRRYVPKLAAESKVSLVSTPPCNAEDGHPDDNESGFVLMYAPTVDFIC